VRALAEKLAWAMYLPSLPYHIIQRGNNREACFIEAENYQYLLLVK